MNVPTSEKAMSDLSDYVRARMGLSFPRERWGELEKKISRAADSLGFPDATSCIQWMLSSRTDRGQLEILSSCLTVGETFFFREGRSLQALTERVFPEIIRAHEHRDRQVRIWSAGCSTGEEPYSVAMVVADYHGLRDWNVSILGTDINETFLRKAETGIYTEWSFRGVSPGIKEKFFKGNGSKFEIRQGLKNMVTFAHLNLVDDEYPALLNNTNAIDLILCRNVLMYLAPDHAQKVICKLHQSLLPAGWLTVSPVEAPLVDRSIFTPLANAGVFLRKQAVEVPARPVVVHEPLSRREPRRPAPVVKRPRPAATFHRALELYTNADYGGAIEVLSVLSALPTAKAIVFLLLSRSYANMGRLPEAETWCLRAIAADTMNAASQYLMALIRIEQQRPDDAMSALRKAIYLEPDFVLAHFTLANLYRRKRKPGESERHLRNALRALQGFRPEEELPESEGMTAGSLIETITATRADGGNHGNPRLD